MSPQLPLPFVEGMLKAITSMLERVQARLRAWQQAGIGLRRAAMLTGIAVSTLQALRRGTARRIRPATAAAILETRASLAPSAYVSEADSYATRERLRRLREEGYTRRHLEPYLGRHAVYALPQAHRRGDRAPRVRVKTWRKVAAVSAHFEGETDAVQTDVPISLS